MYFYTLLLRICSLMIVNNLDGSFNTEFIRNRIFFAYLKIFMGYGVLSLPCFGVLSKL